MIDDPKGREGKADLGVASILYSLIKKRERRGVSFLCLVGPHGGCSVKKNIYIFSAVYLVFVGPVIIYIFIFFHLDDIMLFFL